MKRLLLLFCVCTISANLSAQKTQPGKNLPAPPTAPSDVAPPPPPPLLPPPPPPAPSVEGKFAAPVNDPDFELSVHYNNGNNMVYVKKEGKTETISMTKWEKNKSYYEKKYGKLPPPPAPPAKQIN